jgi:flagellar biosynthetic protein FlhB
MARDPERTEKPTARRRERAREEGQFAHSQELSSAVTLAVALTTLSYTLGTGSGFKSLFNSLLAAGSKGDLSYDLLVQMMHQAGVFFLTTLVPVAAAAAAASLACNIVQGAPIFGANITGLKWEQLNPMRGLSRLKMRVSLLEWLKVLTLVTIAFVALWSTMSQFWQRLISLPAADINGGNRILRGSVTHLASVIVGTAIVISIGDYFLQRRRFEQSLLQTKAEVKEDNKATEGNPLVKRKIRLIQRQQAQRRMMSRIKDADVIITNPTHYAVALEYKPEKMGAPRVVAKGTDYLAQKIKEIAKSHDIPTVENVPLAQALYRSVDLEQEIPVDLYKAVAEVLAYVFKVRKRRI